MKISHDAKKNVKGQSSYLTMNNLEKHKRRDVFFKHSQKFGKVRQLIPPNKTSTSEFQLEMILQKERLIRKEKMDGVLYKGVFIKKYIKRPTNEKV